MSREPRRPVALLLFTLLLVGCGGPTEETAPPAVPARAIELRDLGFAQLENENPEQAEQTFRQLVEVLPEEPLGHANLAIALLRQQRQDEALASIDRALELAPGRPDLLAIRGDVLQWAGRSAEALVAYRQGAETAPDDLEILYALYRLSVTLDGEEAEQAAGWAAERLAELRPENVVALLAQGQRAIGRGDRAAATEAFGRIRELLWQAPPMAETAMQMLLEALEDDDVQAARVPALRLENVLKVTAMYREGLRELATGIQGLPVTDFVGRVESPGFGEPASVLFAGESLAAGPDAVPVAALAVCDLDADGAPDAARVEAGDAPELVVRWAAGSAESAESRLAAPAGARALLCIDLDNDGALDLLVFGGETAALVRGDGAGGLTETAGSGLGAAGAVAAEAVDYDIEGDLDLVLAGADGGLEVLLNDLEGPLEAVGSRVLPELGLAGAADVAVSDLDRDGDLDLLVAHERGVAWLDNLRQGRFAERRAGIDAAPARAVLGADLDNDGRPEVVAAGGGLEIWANRGDDGFERREVAAPGGPFTALAALDADLDGRLDLALAGSGGVIVLRQDAAGGFAPLEVEDGPASAVALAAADLDGDGDLDLLAGGDGGLHRLVNRGAEGRGWVAVQLRGLDEGSSKNNLFGRGSLVEIRSAGAYQMREADGDVVHFGLGDLERPYTLRVVWTNGVPQNRLEPERATTLVEKQLLKGSCPFLYAWNGERMAFVTDLLWGAPLGMPLAPGVWAGADPEELVRVDGAVAVDGRYRMSITEELWEAAFFDYLRLWVVDHPPEVEVASSLRVQPGEQVEDRVLGSRGLRPPAAAWDGRGAEVSDEVARRDEVYADGYRPSRYQGVAAEPWAFTLDLGAAPAAPVRLHLDGWIFPADASLNLALAQRSGPAPTPPRLEVEVGGAWRTLMPSMGFPAGKTKTMVVDTPPLPAGAHRLRIVTGQWLHWDRVAWTTETADQAPRVVARLPAARAELRFRGFSRLVRKAPNAPHEYDYDAVSSESPWLPLPGFYTRFGDVRPLLAEPDDRSVILAAGDEIELVFDASELPPPAAGWKRTVFLESHGWDKDADRNTWAADRVEPLPFRAMSGYPYAPGESFPDTPELRRYRDEWLTREVLPER